MERPARQLLLTTGEPAGIGPEIALMWFVSQHARHTDANVVLVGDIDMLRSKASALDLPLTLINYQPDQPALANQIEVWHMPVSKAVVDGQLNVSNARYVLNTLDMAIDECLAGRFDAVVTGPIHKGVINDAGVPFTGHTEYFADRSNTPLVVMMLAGEVLRVALVTTHLPLRKVPDAITQSLIVDVLSILNHDLQRKFGIMSPRIFVTGLNPHAGEGGHLGMEEIEIITPALQKAQAMGIDCQGPYPADTIFLPEKLKKADAILAMYHDQGLATLKYATFGGGANITLGLPFIRTSVDHGCALDLAGKGIANIGSLNAAIEQALLMSNAQQASE